jgi:hypothetical protein
MSSERPAPRQSPYTGRPDLAFTASPYKKKLKNLTLAVRFFNFFCLSLLAANLKLPVDFTNYVYQKSIGWTKISP